MGAQKEDKIPLMVCKSMIERLASLDLVHITQHGVAIPTTTGAAVMQQVVEKMEADTAKQSLG